MILTYKQNFSFKTGHFLKFKRRKYQKKLIFNPFLLKTALFVNKNVENPHFSTRFSTDVEN